MLRALEQYQQSGGRLTLNQAAADVTGFAAPDASAFAVAPDGVHAERYQLDQQVSAYQREHDVGYMAALERSRARHLVRREVWVARAAMASRGARRSRTDSRDG